MLALRRSFATVTKPSTQRAFIPPNLAISSAPAASATAATTSSATVTDFPALVRLYRGLPKGPLPASHPVPLARQNAGLFAGYSRKHFSPGNETAAPLLHVILIVFGIGYSLAYTSHLSHHKNKQYH